VALSELFLENFRGLRSARVTLDSTTVLFGENDCGKSSLMEALALVLAAPEDIGPQLQPWHFHRAGGDRKGSGVPVRIRLTFGETKTGSWDRPDLGALAPVLGPVEGKPRTLVVEATAKPSPDGGPVPARVEIRSADGRRVARDDRAALAAVKRMNPLVWLRRGVLVASSPAAAMDGAPAETAGSSDVVEIARTLERLLGGTSASPEREVEAGYAAAERLLAEWAPDAQSRQPASRAAVAEILGRALDPLEGSAPRDAPRARKLGVFLLTARLFEHLRGASPGVRPIIVMEEPEAGLHPMTLASVWGLLERLSTQKIVSTHSGTLLSAAPLRSLRRLTRDTSGVVREWRVRDGSLGRDDLRKVSYHLRARRGAACFARCWLLVEGETEYWILPDLARLLGHDLVQEGVACVEFAQCGLKPLAKLARALGIEWHVLADGDRAGGLYADAARGLLQGDQETRRLSALGDRDIEHCFWRHGYAGAFERLAGLAAGAHLPPGRVIHKAIERRSKPGVAFELLAAVAEPGSPGVPPALRRAIETCVALGRGIAPPP
jgi:putative ATP-dependent endonuclease of OLD family